MTIDDNIIIRYFDITIKELEDATFFSVNNILIDNGHLKTESLTERDYFFEVTEKVRNFGISRGFFQKNGDQGWLKLTEKGVSLKDSKKGFNKYLKASNTQSESTYDKIIFWFKNNKITATILFVLLLIWLAFKIFNDGTKAKENLEKWNSNTTEIDQDINPDEDSKAKKSVNEADSNPKVLRQFEIPYLENVPILDKGLFLRYNYNNLQIGGANIDSIGVNARAHDGETLAFNIYERKLELPIHEQPYIEFEYKGTAYSIEVIGRNLSYNCIITKDILPTLNLDQTINDLLIE